MGYEVAIHGNGLVEHIAVGGEPRNPTQRRMIGTDGVVALVNQLARARFLDAPDRYVGASFYRAEGETLQLFGTSTGDGVLSDLTLRLGMLVWGSCSRTAGDFPVRLVLGVTS